MFSLTTFQSLMAAAIILVPFVTGFTSVAKAALNLQTTRYIPLIAVVIGAILGVLVIQLTVLGALVGAVVGLASTGLWEVGKTTIAGIGVKSLNPDNQG